MPHNKSSTTIIPALTDNPIELGFKLLNNLILECPDYMSSLYQHLTATDILMLSMTCQKMRNIIDINTSLLASLVQQKYPMQNKMLHVKEHKEEINISLNAYVTWPTNNTLQGSLSGERGEEVIFDVNIVNMSPHVDSAIPNDPYHLRRWKVISVNHRDGRAVIQAHYRWTSVIMMCIDQDYSLSKPTYLCISNLIMHVSKIAKRSLLATQLHKKCMTCGFRDGLWTSYPCSIPSCRKLCQYCSNERMITERTLKQQWKVSNADIIILRSYAYRFHSTTITNRCIKTLIPRACVLEYFKCSTWPDFLTLTNKRAIQSSLKSRGRPANS